MTLPGQITGVHTVGVPVTDQNRAIAADADAVHAAMRASGVDADDVLRWPGVPPCSRSATRTATAWRSWNSAELLLTVPR